ncbi:hypothetical protein DIPPA_18099 [Diplonema papillatum]|nr:hypothetical protein DIPPA_18099 [Diplonema papillatum]
MEGDTMLFDCDPLNPMEMGDEELDELQDAVRGNDGPFSLSVCGRAFGTPHAAVAALCHILRPEMHRLRGVNASYTRLGARSAAVLVDCLTARTPSHQRSGVATLSLAYCHLGVTAIPRISRSLSSASSHLQRISLRYNPITAQGLGILLRWSAPVTAIDVRFCGILTNNENTGDKGYRSVGLRFVVEGLQCNTMCSELRLGGNGFSPADVREMCDAVDGNRGSSLAGGHFSYTLPAPTHELFYNDSPNLVRYLHAGNAHNTLVAMSSGLSSDGLVDHSEKAPSVWSRTDYEAEPTLEASVLTEILHLENAIGIRQHSVGREYAGSSMSPRRRTLTASQTPARDGNGSRKANAAGDMKPASVRTPTSSRVNGYAAATPLLLTPVDAHSAVYPSPTPRDPLKAAGQSSGLVDETSRPLAAWVDRTPQQQPGLSSAGQSHAATPKLRFSPTADEDSEQQQQQQQQPRSWSQPLRSPPAPPPLFGPSAHFPPAAGDYSSHWGGAVGNPAALGSCPPGRYPPPHLPSSGGAASFGSSIAAGANPSHWDRVATAADTPPAPTTTRRRRRHRASRRTRSAVSAARLRQSASPVRRGEGGGYARGSSVPVEIGRRAAGSAARSCVAAEGAAGLPVFESQCPPDVREGAAGDKRDRATPALLNACMAGDVVCRDIIGDELFSALPAEAGKLQGVPSKLIACCGVPNVLNQLRLGSDDRISGVAKLLYVLLSAPCNIRAADEAEVISQASACVARGADPTYESIRRRDDYGLKRREENRRAIAMLRLLRGERGPEPSSSRWRPAKKVVSSGYGQRSPRAARRSRSSPRRSSQRAGRSMSRSQSTTSKSSVPAISTVNGREVFHQMVSRTPSRGYSMPALHQVQPRLRSKSTHAYPSGSTHAYPSSAHAYPSSSTLAYHSSSTDRPPAVSSSSARSYPAGSGVGRPVVVAPPPALSLPMRTAGSAYTVRSQRVYSTPPRAHRSAVADGE